MTRRPRTQLRLVTTLLATAVLSACAEDKPLNTFEPRGPQAQMIDDLARPIWYIMAIVFVLVVGGGIALAIKGRVKPEDFDYDDLPRQVHGNEKLEIGWTIAPAVLLAIVCIPTVASIWKLEARNDAGELDVMVIGRQWWWEYRYDIDGDGFFEDADGDGEIWGVDGGGVDGQGDDGDRDDREWPLNLALDDDDLSVANELVIPTGVQVDLVITSGDVIHSFWIPRLNGKRDAVPGRLHTWNLEADEPGKYNGWCTEFCGLSHARMRMSTIALAPSDFETWLANQIEPAALPEAAAEDEEASPEAAGRVLFEQNCVSCHVVRTDGSDEIYGDDFTPPQLKSGAAPDLTHFATRSVFAGAIYSPYITDGAGNPVDADDDALDVATYLSLSENGRFNVAQLKRWISNAPGQKDMAPEDLRGMPAFPALNDEDLDNLVAYLATLD
ncbi:MAG: cytochrome c oxidase subunit II [Actinomycetota bacterium]|nr:cytochrome c oxidase subunit II [Actinomycetota bacterium]